MIVRLLCLLVGFLPATLLAQNFLSGQLTDRAGNPHTRVLIRALNTEFTPNTIQYKVDAGAVLRTVTAAEIDGFVLDDGTLFLSRTVAVDQSRSDRLERLSTERAPLYETQTVFLRPLLQGDVALYRYQTSGRLLYFVERAGEAAAPLVYKRYRQDNREFFNRDFQTYLLENFPHPAASYVSVKDMPYNDEALVQHLELYAATQPGVETERVVQPVRTLRWNLHASGGMLNYAFPEVQKFQSRFSPGRVIERTFADRPSGLGYQFGAAVEMSFPAANYHLSALLRVHYTTFDYRNDAENTDVRMTSLRGSPAVRYYLASTDALTPYLEGRLELVLHTGELITIDDVTFEPFFNRVYPGAAAGVLLFNRVTVEGSYGFNQYNETALSVGVRF